MTVAATTNRKTYTGDNVTTSFATSPVIFYATSDLQVRVTVIATGVSTLLTLNTHYTVSGGSSAGAVGTVSLAGGSSPHGALLSTEKLVILRVLPLTQGVDLVNNNNSDAEVLEAALDKLTDVDQQLSERQDRALTFPEGDVSGSTTTLPTASARAGTMLGFDALGVLTTLIVTAGTTLVNLASSVGSSLIGFVAAGVGAVLRTVQAKLRDTVSVTDFGADPLGLADSTAAFNAAILASDDVYVPAGTYLLSALTSFRLRNLYLHGCGRASILKFNTTGKGITAGPWIVGDQKYTLVISDLAFKNVTNTPSAFISQEFYVNSKFIRLYFSNCAATWCIDNVSGYGTSIIDCVFSDVTGGGVRGRNNLNESPNYSFVMGISGTDFTRCSGNGLEMERANCLDVRQSVFEGCLNGIVTSTSADGLVSHGIVISACDFESNVTSDLDLQTNGGSYWGRASVIGCNFLSTGLIKLGSKSKITIIGCQAGTGVTVSGSANAEAYFVGCQISNFTQSGSFGWIYLDGGALVSAGTITGSGLASNVAPSAAWGVNQAKANQLITIANNGTYDLASGSGLVIIHSDTTGNIGLFLAAAGATTLISDPASVYSVTAATATKTNFFYNGGTAKYRIENKTGGSANYYICSLQSRAAS